MTTENNLQKAYDTSYLHIFKMAFLRKLGNKIDMYTLKPLKVVIRGLPWSTAVIFGHQWFFNTNEKI